jgi:hypothetical protein
MQWILLFITQWAFIDVAAVTCYLLGIVPLLGMASSPVEANLLQ